MFLGSFYRRRSLLTQSPIVDFSPDSMVPIDQMHDSGSAAAATTNPSVHFNGDSSSVHITTKRFSSDTGIPSTTIESNELKKRKLSFSDGDSLPIRNLEKEIFLYPDAVAAGKEQSWQLDEFDNDEFYQGIDFDALEEQAAKQLRSKSELNDKPKEQNLDFLDCPSFDLGI